MGDRTNARKERTSRRTNDKTEEWPKDLRVPTTPEALARAMWKPIQAKTKDPDEPEEDEQPLPGT